MDPRSAASGQLLTKLQRPGLPSVQHVPRHFSNVPPSQEDCLGCRTFTAVGAQCQHCRGPYCSESCKKQDCQVHVCEFNYTVEASLMDVKHPYISRTLSIPYTLTFEELHQSLQIAFSWRPTMNYEFCMKRVLIASADRIATLAWNKDERARFDAFKDGSTTYVVEAMKDTYADRRILGYCCDASFGLVHCLKIRVASYGSWKQIRCTQGIGHPYAEGFGLDGWCALKDAYQKDQPTLKSFSSRLMRHFARMAISTAYVITESMNSISAM
ncbi:hypothetical protein V8E51_004889 [Hyaloscypha variabilis]